MRLPLAPLAPLALPLLLACAGPEDDGGPTPGSTDGADGADGADGDDGTDGTDGTDGSDGTEVEPRFEALAAAIEADLADNYATGASVAVWLDGEAVWVGGFGAAVPDTDTAVTPQTLFMIGSDTKKLAAIGLLQQVEAGRATLDTTVADVLPDLSMDLGDAFLSARVHDLLSHQGGVVDSAPWTTETEDAVLESYTYGEFASAFYPMNPAGRIWNYANPNFSLAGLLDERLSGTAWAERQAEDLYAPLGLTHTVARKADLAGPVSTGMGYANGRGTGGIQAVELDDHWEHAWVRPAGLVWSTALDQARVMGFLLEGDEAVLSDALHAALVDGQVPMYADLPGTYGYGLMQMPTYVAPGGEYDTPVWMHGGNTVTHTSTFVMLPDHGFGISILSNGYGDDFSASVEAAATSLLELGAPATPAEPPFEAAALPALTGTYSDPFNVGEVEVTLADDTLFVDMPTLDALDIPYERELVPVSTRTWYLQAQGQWFDVTFLDGPEGETYLRNRVFVATRPAPGETVRAARGAPTAPRGLPAHLPPAPSVLPPPPAR